LSWNAVREIKRALGLHVYSPEREAWILDRVARENPGPLDSTAIRRVFERIIDESRRLERIASEGAERTARTAATPSRALSSKKCRS
jgi:chorismate mutase